MHPSLAVRRFVFTYNSTLLEGALTNLTGASDIVAVMVPTGGRFNVAVATGAFFGLSAFFHGLWVVGYYWPPLGKRLYGWLAAAFAPLRWLEYGASASLMVAVLTVISGAFLPLSLGLGLLGHRLTVPVRVQAGATRQTSRPFGH